MAKYQDTVRSADYGNGIITRKMPVIAVSGLKTVDEQNRSVEITIATETPCIVYDFVIDALVPEVLMMEGVRFLDQSKEVILLDHHRRATEFVRGSCRDIVIKKDLISGRAFFAADTASTDAFQKVLDRHIKDFSAGYTPVKSRWLDEGEEFSINGKTYEGPLMLRTEWIIKEVSVTPIGADPNAKARSENTIYSGREENRSMNKKQREKLEAMGLSPNASEAEAKTFLRSLAEDNGVIVAEDGAVTRKDRSEGGQDVNRKSTPAPEVKTPANAAPVDNLRSAGNNQPPVDVETIVQRAAREERNRVNEIRGICTSPHFNIPEADMERMINDGHTVDQVRAFAFNHLNTQPSPTDGGGLFRPARLVSDEMDKFRAAVEGSLFLRTGYQFMEGEKPAPGADELRGYSLKGLCREFLVRTGIRVPSDPYDIAIRALQSTDFPNVFANIANKHLTRAFETQKETWRDWCGTAQAPDFKEQTLVNISEAGDLEETPDGMPAPYDDRKEGPVEKYQLKTYTKVFALTRQTIINDDLNVFSAIPKKYGIAVARLIGDTAYAVLIANGNMGDGIPLFHTNHANIGVAGVVSVATLDEGELMMSQHKDIGGKRRLNIEPVFFIAPTSIKGAARQFFNTVYIGGAENQPYLKNTHAEQYVRIYESRLNDDSTTRWYLAGEKGTTVVVIFLNGNETPRIKQQDGFRVEGIEYFVGFDVAAKALSHKSLFKNDGA